MNGSRNPFSFQIVSVRSQNFANTANKTGRRVKQLQHVSDGQDLRRFCQVFVKALRPFQLKVEYSRRDARNETRNSISIRTRISALET